MLTNSVLISVILMSVLCLLKFNILLAILIAALAGGIVAGMPLVGDGNIFGILIGGMGGNAETALSYILLGSLAYAIQASGLATMLSRGIEKIFGKSGKVFLFILAGIACFSQNLIPIHIAFIPILIPPLLSMMNHMRIDRRASACALTFGLKAPYIALPTGFGWIFHGIVASSMADNGMEIAQGEIYKYMWLPALGMFCGLFIAILFTYRKPRDYEDIAVVGEVEEGASDKFELKHIGALAGAVGTFVIQLITGSLPLGALTGLIIMLCFGTIPIKKMDETMLEGIKMMGLISFVMMVAAGYGSVLRESGGVEQIVEASAAAFGNNKPVTAAVMLLLGLIITMGIGTSFGTIPIVATIYVPLAMALGFSVPATVILIGTAAALGDAGSPASDSTLGPTAGLNADGQHDHIWDTCVPTFLHYNIPLLIFGFIGALIF